MNHPIIRFHIRDLGTMTAELYPEKAPKTVENFLKLVKSDFFCGLIFHRVIPGFMIQGGGYTPDFGETDTPSIKGEFRANGFADNDIPHKRGVLSMARTNMPNSASSQFFIMHADAPHLDRQYAAFGALTDGFDVLDQIATTPTGRFGYFADVPKAPIIIDRVELVQE